MSANIHAPNAASPTATEAADARHPPSPAAAIPSPRRHPRPPRLHELTVTGTGPKAGYRGEPFAG